ncbi:hypothetical protein Q3G72_016865 [Acer saccharum]|nr:hypothetical protein Q3G72_016865 [Acer saccharum]
MALLTHPKTESEAEGTINMNSPCINLEKLPHLTSSSTSPSPHLAYLRAGSHKQIFFDPTNRFDNCENMLEDTAWCRPGIFIYGIQASYRGFYSRDMAPLNLNPKTVHGWHKTGGTLLQTSRGGFHLHNIVDAIQRYGFNQVNKSIFVFLTVKLGEWI